MKSPDWAEPYEAVAAAVVRLFYPHVEAVIHDVASDTVLRIWNPTSARRPGDPSLIEAELLTRLSDGHIVGPYSKVGLNGEPISSISVVIGGGSGLLCINFDRSVITTALQTLQTFAADLGESTPAALFERDWREELNVLVHEWCRANNLNIRQLTPADRRSLIKAMDDKGVFAVRHATAHLSAILKVSRATIYSALQSARDTTH